jgi:folate-binding protein YgfZ
MMNTEWGSFIEEFGAGLESGRAVHFGHPEAELPAALNDNNLCSDLTHLGLIAAQGSDADEFLQGQLTCDIRQVTLDHSVLGAFCSPKGRTLACFRLFRRRDALYLELPRALVESTLARLRKYVLRAKATLEDASDYLVRFGVAGPNAETLLTERLGAVPDAVNGVVHTTGVEPGITMIRSPGAIPRFELHGPLLEMQAIWKTLDENVVFTSAEPWRLLEILAGMPTIYPETVEAFTPQMINLQFLDGISFQKGCYTGQEVVARTHYLGKLKRRMYLGQVDAVNPPRPGDPLFSPQADASQGAGRLVDAARHPQGGYAVLATALIECAEQGVLQVGDANGPVLKLTPLPYGFG